MGQSSGSRGGLCPSVLYILGRPKHKHCPCCPSTTWFDLSGLQSHVGQGNLARSTWFLPPSDLTQVLGPSLPSGGWRGRDQHLAPHGRLCLCSNNYASVPSLRMSPRGICALDPCPEQRQLSRNKTVPYPASHHSPAPPRRVLLESQPATGLHCQLSLLLLPAHQVRPNSQHRPTNKQMFEKGCLLIRKITSSVDE